MADILDALEDWGCNIDEGLTRLGGDEDFYRMLLSDFTHENDMSKLEEAMRTENYLRAFEAAHGMKGDTGNLSLTPLYEAMCLLVEDLRPVVDGKSPEAGVAPHFSEVRALFAEFLDVMEA